VRPCFCVWRDLAGSECCTRFVVVLARGGRREAAAFQLGATLSDYYDPDEVIARYREVGITLDPGIFTARLKTLARAVITSNMSDELRLPVTGLCLGYPLEETLALIRKPG
jgi:hypothetical protein